jgi:hypothetical protein
LPQLIELGKDRRSEHIFYVNSATTFGIQEKEKFANRRHYVFVLEALVHILQMDKSWDEFGDILLEVSLRQIAIPSCIIQTYMNTSLEQVVLPNNGVEK